MLTARMALTCAALVLASAVQVSLAGPVYDAAGDFSASGNPSGRWTYGNGFGSALNPFSISAAGSLAGALAPQ